MAAEGVVGGRFPPCFVAGGAVAGVEVDGAVCAVEAVEGGGGVFGVDGCAAGGGEV